MERDRPGNTLADSNPFDQFDAPGPPGAVTAPTAGNPFDQFDARPSASEPKSDAQPSSGLHDIKQGIGTGAIAGASMVLGFPSDVWQMLDRGYQYAATKSAETMGLITPEEGAALRQPVPGAEDYNWGSQKINEHLTGLAKSLGADTTEPQTRAGRYAKTITSFLPGAVGLGATSLRDAGRAALNYGVIPGAVSEAAGQATEETPLEPYARIAGAIAPTGLTQVAGAARRAMSPVNHMLEGVSDADLQSAQGLVDRSRAAGAPLTVPEAIGSATGNATRLGDIQRVVEQSPKGATIMRPFMAQRPAQTEALGQSMFDATAPAGVDPYEVAPKVQVAANQTVSDANAARTSAVTPHYTAAGSDRVPVDDMHDFLNRIDTMIAGDKTGIMGPELSNLRSRLVETPAVPSTPAQRIPTTTPTGATIYRNVPATPGTPEVPITDIDNLDRVRKYFRDRLDLPQWAQDATSKEEGAKVGSLLNDLRQRMVSASPEFATGKNLYEDITNNSFNPLVRSPTGQLAKAETYPKQAQILFNSNPLPGSERAVGQAVRQVAQADPDAAAQMVRMHLEKTFNEATQNNLPGPNQFGGPKFAAVVSGNSQQAKNLEAAMKALPNGNLRWDAFRKGMDIMEGMGMRQPMGSQTAANLQIAKWMEQGHPAGEFLAQSASPGKWPSLVDRVYRHVMYDRNTGELARVFTQGSVDDLRKIVSGGKRSFQGQAAMIGALARQGAASTPEASQGQP